jgi:hypothetical protein
VDWTDIEAWSRPVPAGKPGSGTDPEVRWGHRNVNRKIQEREMFFGFYLPAAVMTKDEDGPAVPELARRITVASSSHDPAAALAGVLASLPAGGVGLGDILADSGYSHRQPGTASKTRARTRQTRVTTTDRTPAGRNVRPKCEHGPWASVKILGWSGAGSNRRPSAFQVETALCEGARRRSRLWL